MTDPVTEPYAQVLSELAAIAGTKAGSTVRYKTLQRIAPLVPEERALVKALLALTQMRRRLRRKYLKPKVRTVGTCSICHEQLPHTNWLDKSRHGFYINQRKAIKARWLKYPETQDRRAQTNKARATILAARHDRWIAALTVWDSVRTEHLLRTQGREAAITLFRSFGPNFRKRLLRKVPRTPGKPRRKEYRVPAIRNPYSRIARARRRSRGLNPPGPSDTLNAASRS